MMWGAFCGFLYLKYLAGVVDAFTGIAIFLLILFGSLLPDIDHHKSKVGRRVKIIAVFFEHRGFFHSVFAIILWYFLFNLFLPLQFTKAILFGYVAHLFIDAFNHYGVSPFAPLIKWKIKGPLLTNGIEEKIIYYGLLIANIYFFIQEIF